MTDLFKTEFSNQALILLRLAALHHHWIILYFNSKNLFRDIIVPLLSARLLAMPIYQSVSTTPPLNDLIHNVAMSIKGKSDGKEQVSRQEGVTFVYNLDATCFALGREYILVYV